MLGVCYQTRMRWRTALVDRPAELDALGDDGYPVHDVHDRRHRELEPWSELDWTFHHAGGIVGFHYGIPTLAVKASQELMKSGIAGRAPLSIDVEAPSHVGLVVATRTSATRLPCNEILHPDPFAVF
jgi:hypothetical protein